jgi:hypothetical protein
MTATYDMPAPFPTPLRTTPDADGVAARIAARVIDRVAPDAFFIGRTLAVCQRRFDVETEALARFLGCPVAALTRLALTPQPDRAAPDYATALRHIADQVGANAAQLAAVLELAEPPVRSMPGPTTAVGLAPSRAVALFMS